jgi:hypothetical protein
MSIRDLHSNIRTKTVVKAGANASAAGQAGVIIDRQGYGGVEFIFNYGEITATDATITVVVKDGTATDALASVADTYLLGTEVLAGVAATTPRASGVSKNVTKRLGYVGDKRYVQASIGAATVSAGVKVAVAAVLHSPQLAPQDNP